jgi:hypothetical protein
MTKIFFFSPNGYALLKDEALRQMLQQSHGWQADGAAWIYGVCVPKHDMDPNDVADCLTALGVHVVPGMHDETKPHPDIVTALSAHGLTAQDRGADIARKMHAACEMPVMKPHYF